jgi:hypothetical protein
MLVHFGSAIDAAAGLFQAIADEHLAERELPVYDSGKERRNARCGTPHIC